MQVSASSGLERTRKNAANSKASRIADVRPLDGNSSETVRVPTPLAVAVIATFLPVELSFYIGGLRFTAARLLLILFFPFVFIWMTQKVSSGRYRFVASDLFVLLAGFWMIFAPAMVFGAGEALNHGGPDALEFCMGYLVIRTMPSKHGLSLSLAGFFCLVIACAALLALLDPLTGRFLTHEILGKMTGNINLGPAAATDLSGAYRYGLLRATGPVEHPILLAVSCSAALLIALSVPIRLRAFIFVASALGATFAFSSAAIQAIILGCGLLIYRRILANIRLRWVGLISVGAAGFLALFLVSESPVGIVLRHFTFDEESGYYRYMTWFQVIDAVAPSPWYGIGFGPYPDELDINHSVDSLWLVEALRSGFPGSILIALSMIGAASLPTSGPGVNLTIAESKLGMALGIVIFLLIYLAFTVDFWGPTWIFCGLAIGLRAYLGELGRLGIDRPVETHYSNPRTRAQGNRHQIGTPRGFK